MDTFTLSVCMLLTMKILYSRKFSLDKYFANPSYLCLAEIFDGIDFRNIAKVAINMGQKIRGTKFSPM